MWWRYWLPGFLLAVGAGLVLYLMLLCIFGYIVASSIVLPFALGAILGYGCRVGKAFRVLLGLLMIGAIMLGLFSMDIIGVFCGLVLGGLALGPAVIGMFIGWSLRNELKKSQFNQRSHLPILLFMLMPVLWAIIEGPQSHTSEIVVTSAIMPVSPEQAWDAVMFYEEVNHPAPWLLRFGLPRPLYTQGRGTQVGDIKICIYSKGKLAKRITQSERGKLLSFNIVHQEKFENRSIRLIGGSFSFEPIGENQTRVTLKTEYEPLLGPRMWWRSAEQIATHTLHGHVLLGMNIKAQKDRPERP